ncbi:MAG: SMP-30/gluconolactonase/LRE family protein [Phycisphaerae bacterium]
MNKKWYSLIVLLLVVVTTGWSAESVVEPGAEIEKLAGNFKFTEGPAADAEGNIFFTDIPNNRIHKWSLDGKLSAFREDSGGANGLFFDKEGNLIACEGGGRQLVSIDPKGNVTVLADKYEGKRFNSLNDLWIDPKGGIYFTDPRYGRSRDDMEQEGEHVYYLAPDRKKVIRVIDDMVRPNGIVGTPDGKLLYVTDPGGNKTFVYTIDKDGTLSNKKLFAPEGSDGMTIDNEGNVYLTTKVVAIYNSKGEKIETINVPEQPANVCFGGEDKRTLFITARTSLYSIKMRVKGAEPKRKVEYRFTDLDRFEIPAAIEGPWLVGKPLPELKRMKIELPANSRDKMILVCFWDMNQRPSRYYIRQLAERAKDLAQEDVIVVGVHVSDVNDKSLNEWVNENNIPFPIGRTFSEQAKSAFKLGVESFPWLILTDRRHIITAEGFELSNLNEKILQAGIEPKFEEDIIKTSAGDLKITFIGHGTLMFAFNGKFIHVDPVSREADYTEMPKADLILVTHEHGDHLDTKVIKTLRKEGTNLVLTKACAEKVAVGIIMQNGDVQTVDGLKIEAVPAYNIVHKRPNGEPFHPKGQGNGYIITLGDKRVYVAGDTENIPEMKRLRNIDIAFLPMNLPYTMTPEMVADAAKAFEPKILYPYHYGQTDPSILVDLLKDSKNIEVRIRKMR